MTRRVRIFAAALAALIAAPSLADENIASAHRADVVFLGEVHVNPAHHRVQAEWVERLTPAALVFEMLTPAQAEAITPDNRDDRAALAEALQWEASGWPDLSYYHAIMQAAPGASILGAGVPRAEARQAFGGDVATTFGPDAARFGLTEPLSAAEQSQREQLQAAAHCDALSADLLPKMVAIQRLRDARIAQVALAALAEHGAPVVVITGNGHARKDWGAPAALAQAAPEVTIFALGQGETGAPPDGVFDATTEAPPPDRPDPCAGLRG